MSTTAESVPRHTPKGSVHISADIVRRTDTNLRTVGKSMENQANKGNHIKGKGAKVQMVDQRDQKDLRSDTRKRKVVASQK